MKIRIKGLEFEYRSVKALKGVTLEIEESKLTAIVGPNGSGKSTLLKCINRILKPRKGIVYVDGKSIEDLSHSEIAKMIGYVPQSVQQTFPATVFDVVLMGRRPHISWIYGKRDFERVVKVLKLLNIEDIAMRDFNELSGGQKQKVLIARALAQEPEILLLDEPTANLDLRHQLEVMKLVKDLTRNGLTAIVAVHDLNLASRFADKIVMMKDGNIFAVGEAEEVLTPNNIESVYGIKVKIIYVDGYLYVIPI